MLDDLDDIQPLFHGAPSTTEFKKLRKRIIRNVREAIDQYNMIERDARWLVCLSGGKDSYTLLAALYEDSSSMQFPDEFISRCLDGLRLGREANGQSGDDRQTHGQRHGSAD